MLAGYLWGKGQGSSPLLKARASFACWFDKARGYSEGLPSTDRHQRPRGIVPGGSTATSCPKAGVSHTPDPPTMPPLRWPPKGLSCPTGDGGTSWLQPWDLPRGRVGCELAPARPQEGRSWALAKPNVQGFGMAGRKRQEHSSAQSCHHPAAELFPALLSHCQHCSIQGVSRTPCLPRTAQGCLLLLLC